MPSLVVLCSADFEPLSLCRKFSISQSRNSASLLSQSLSLRVDSPTQVCFNATPFGFQLMDHDSSSSQSSQSNNHDLIATPGINSHDQCHEISEGDIIGQIKPIYSTSHHITADIDYSPTMTFMPYSCGDLYFNGLLSAFAPIMGITTTRVPLPLDILQDEPIYVNVKQYNGILRRRHSRAKLHAQNKLIKARKPYLHESRHRHAVNRVRGSGGRFLSTKKPPQSDTTSTDHHSNNARKLSISNAFY